MEDSTNDQIQEEQRINAEIYEQEYLGVGKCSECKDDIPSHATYQKVVIHFYEKNVSHLSMRLFCVKCMKITDSIVATNEHI